MDRPRYSARYPRLEKQRRIRQLGYVLIAGCVGIAAVMGFVGWTAFKTQKLDVKTGCPITHSAPIAQTVILVDETDQLSRDELAYAKALIWNEYHWLPIGGRLTVRNIVSDINQAEDIVVCRMDDGSASDGLIENPRKLRSDFQRIAGSRLNDLFTALRVAPVQKSSPILEYIAAAMDNPSFEPPAKSRRLVILSDMAQHSNLYTQYGRHPKAHLSEDAAAELTRDMHGVDVRIQYIRRPSLVRIQTERQRQFWIDWLQKQGANVALGHTLMIGEPANREVWDNGSG